MKKIVVTLLLFIGLIGYSQTNGITYQAVILNPSGDQLPGVNNTNVPLVNKNICLKFSIIDQNSQSEYTETVQTTTDEFGMVNLIIGTGLQIGGYASSFSNILWNANPKRLKVDLSTTGVCSYYTEISNQPFTSVPFAMFAATAGTPGTPGPAGLQGIQGVAGPTGATGLTGAVGPQGPIGLTGAIGPQGLPGIQGAVGPTGATGLTGAVGPQGPIGLIGAIGPQGLPGTNGTNGLDGAVGPQGPQGPQGLAGTNGVDGAVGPQGPQGLAGTNGVDGAVGPQGLQGLQGIAGTNGTNGTNGSDATVTVGAISSTSNANGATVTSGELKLSPADATNGGIVTTGTQTFAGNKTFNSDIYVNGITVGNGAGNEFNTKLNVLGRASFRTNVTNSGLIFDGYSPSGSLEVSRIYTDATSGTPSDFVLGTYPNAHSNQLYLKQSNGFVGVRTESPTTALDVNGTVTATSFAKSGGSSSQFLKADGSIDSTTYLTAAGTAANVSGVVAIANGGTAATTAAVALTNLGAAPIDSPTFTGVPLAPTPINTTNTTQIATTAFIQDLLLNAPSSSSSTLSGAIWTSATTGTLNGTGFTIGGYTMTSTPPSLLNQNYSSADYSSNPLSATQQTSYFMSGSSWTVTFNAPISNLKLYIYWRGGGIGGSSFYQFDQAFSIASGSTGMTNSGNNLNISGWGKGILEFSGPITTLTLSADGTSCCSGHTMTFASGGGGIASASGTGQVIRIDSPNLAGIPTAPTAALGTNSTQLATTAFVTNAVSTATSGAFVDLTSAQTVAGAKTFSDGLTVINKPFLPTKLNQSQINSLTGVEEGMVVYNTSTRKLQIFSVGNTDTTNELYSGNFSTGRDDITQTFVPQVSGSVYAFQFFAKRANSSGMSPHLFVDYPGGTQYVDLPGLTTSGEWITINLPSPITVVAGNSYNFTLWSGPLCFGELILGTNSNYSNGSIINSFPCGGSSSALNGDDLMFRVLITPSSTTAYWLNLN